jgi:undecaprenyl-diphosphatase
MNFINYIVSLDSIIQKWILVWRNVYWDNFFFTVTILGNWITIAILFLIAVLILRKYHKSFLIGPFLVVILGSGIMTLLTKLVVGRARPTGDIPLYIEKLSSFPSAHAALSFAFFGFIIYCLLRSRLSRVIKITLTTLSIFMIIAVGFSRLYLGVHYTSDVLAGYLVGLLWVLVAMHISKAPNFLWR